MNHTQAAALVTEINAETEPVFRASQGLSLGYMSVSPDDISFNQSDGGWFVNIMRVYEGGRVVRDLPHGKIEMDTIATIRSRTEWLRRRGTIRRKLTEARLSPTPTS